MNRPCANAFGNAASVRHRVEQWDPHPEAQTPQALATIVARLAKEEPECLKATVVWTGLEHEGLITEPAAKVGEQELLLLRSASVSKEAAASPDARKFAIGLCRSGSASSPALILEFAEPRRDRHSINNIMSRVRVSAEQFCRQLELVELKTSLRRLERSESLQRALYAISDLAGSDRDMRDMLRGIHSIVGQLMYAENFFIVRHDAERDTLRFLYYADVADLEEPDYGFDVPMSTMAHSLTWYLLRDGKPLMGSNEQLAAQVSGPLAVLGQRCEDWLGVPMLQDGKVVGALVVQSYQPRVRYSEADRALLEFVGSHILTALERKQGKEDLERRVQLRTLQLAEANRELQREIGEKERAEGLQAALFRIAQLATADVSETEFYRRVHAIVGGLINAENFYIALLSEDGKSLDFAYFIDKTEQDKASRPIGSGLSEYVLQHGKALLHKAQILHLVQLGSIKLETAGLGPVADCWLGVPLIVGEKTIGLIVVQSYEENSVYSGADEDLLGFVASQVAYSLERRRAVEASRKAYAQLKQRVEQRTEELNARNVELEVAYAKLKNAQEQAVQAEKLASIGQLAAGVAHEINNPIGYVSSNLVTLQGYLSNLLGLIEAYEGASVKHADDAMLAELRDARQRFEFDFLSGDVKQLISESREGVDRVRKIIHDLKDFSRRDRHESWVRADIHQGLESTLNIVSNQLKYKAQIVKTFADLPLVECLPSELNQVFLNILMNAGQAIKQQGIITVCTGYSDGKVWVDIGDDGEGIPPEVLPRIFDPFFTTKPVGSGTGLGLSISYGIVAKHHGTIEVTSVPGQGTLMRIELPVEQPK